MITNSRLRLLGLAFAVVGILAACTNGGGSPASNGPAASNAPGAPSAAASTAPSVAPASAAPAASGSTGYSY